MGITVTGLQQPGLDSVNNDTTRREANAFVREAARSLELVERPIHAVVLVERSTLNDSSLLPKRVHPGLVQLQSNWWVNKYEADVF